MSSARYPTPPFRRLALAPGLLAAIVLLAGIALIDGDAFTIVLYATAILAAVVAVFAWQARQFWWIPPLAAIVVLWNPVYPFGFSGDLWLGAQYAATAVFIACAVLIKVRNPDERTTRNR